MFGVDEREDISARDKGLKGKKIKNERREKSVRACVRVFVSMKLGFSFFFTSHGVEFLVHAEKAELTACQLRLRKKGRKIQIGTTGRTRRLLLSLSRLFLVVISRMTNTDFFGFADLFLGGVSPSPSQIHSLDSQGRGGLIQSCFWVFK